MSNATLIADAWNHYRQLCVPTDAPPVQVAESRQAFFAGASILLTTLINAVSAEDEITESDMHIMESLHAFGHALDKKVLPHA